MTNMEMLLKKLTDLEERVAILESKNSKHKVNMATHITYHNPSINYSDWIKTLEPTQENMEQIFSQGYIQGMSIMLCSLIEQSTDPPIVFNPNKKYQLFIYVDGKWTQMENKDFELCIDIQQSKILKIFKQWKEENPKYLTDEYSEILSKYHQNILGTKYPKITTVQKIRNTVYNSLL
ncbi:MAG: hypothetical protein CBC91_00610 [Rickettsiales bacterium TMED131]|nr:MAG: hypothetical protein CBC91_00610 [Rickettsiales bacterium TMED131]